MSSFNPSPDAQLAELIDRSRVALTVEGHYRTGGLGSYVAEVIADNGLGTPLSRIGIDSMPRGFSGDEGYLAEAFGLTPAAIAARTTTALQAR